MGNYNFLVPYEPILMNRPSEKGAFPEMSNSIDNDKTKLDKVEGLSSDVNGFTQKWMHLMNNMSLSTGSTSKYLQLYNKDLTILKNNKEQYDEALKWSKDNKSFNDFAVTNNMVLGLDLKEQSLTYIPINDISKNRNNLVQTENGFVYSSGENKYKLLTNREALRYRHDYVTDNNLIDVVLGSSSYSNIQTKLIDVIDKFKNKTIKIGKSGATRQKIEDGILRLEESEYQLTESFLKPGEDGKALVIELREWLTPTEQGLMQLRAAVTGKSFEETIIESVNRYTSERHENVEKDTFREKGLPGSKSGGGGDGLSGSQELNWLTMLTENRGKVEPMYVLNIGSENEMIATNVSTWSNPVTLSNKPISRSVTLNKLITETGLNSAGQVNSVYFGEQRMDEDAWNSIVFNAAEKIAVVRMIAVEEADGSVHPDFDLMGRIKAAEEEINKRGGNLSDSDKESIYEDFKVYSNIIPSLLDPDKEIPEEYTRLFIVMSGYGTDDGNLVSSNNRSVTKINHREEGNLRDLLTRTINDPSNYADNKKGGTKLKSFFLGRDNIYKGNIYIPYSPDRITTASMSKTLNEVKWAYSPELDRSSDNMHNKVTPPITTWSTTK